MNLLARFGLVALLVGPLAGCGSQPIRELPLSEQLKSVRAGGTDIVLVEETPLADEDLSELADDSGLRILQLDNLENRITTVGVEKISMLKQLEHLRIRGGTIDDKALTRLSTMPNLRILNLPQGQFTDEGLARLKALPNLQMLRIGSPRITDEGIAALKEISSLRQIHLIDVPITDNGLATLASMAQLESLYIDGVNFSDEALDDLYERRPRLHVHFNQTHHDRDPHKHVHSGP